MAGFLRGGKRRAGGLARTVIMKKSADFTVTLRY